MIERDYIMRMIAQLSAVIARILFAKNAQNYAEAQQLAQNAYEQLLGLNGELVEQMDAATLAMLLGEKEKIKVLATLLREEGEILHLQGNAAAGTRKYEKTLALFQEAQRQSHSKDDECESAIAVLLGKINKNASTQT